MEAYPYFPSVVYREEHPDWVDYTKQVVQKYYESTPGDGVIQTGQMTGDPALKFLVDYLILASDTILRTQGYNMDIYELYVSDLWGQEINCNGGTNVHVHRNSQISGWFFLETSENCSYPVYYDTRMNKQMIELDRVPSTELTNASSEIHFNNVKPGTFLFANSWMNHAMILSPGLSRTSALHFIIAHREKL
jgi:uncharacterized protein (TIGR02466 family)